MKVLGLTDTLLIIKYQGCLNSHTFSTLFPNYLKLRHLATWLARLWCLTLNCIDSQDNVGESLQDQLWGGNVWLSALKFEDWVQKIYCFIWYSETQKLGYLCRHVASAISVCSRKETDLLVNKCTVCTEGSVVLSGRAFWVNCSFLENLNPTLSKFLNNIELFWSWQWYTIKHLEKA
jgi:hypothetical protein